MISVTATSSHCSRSSIFFPCPSISPSLFLRSKTQILSFIVFPRTRCRQSESLLLSAKKRATSPSKPRKRRKRRQAPDESSALEAEILDFMEKSPNPKAFPTKQELIDAGRIDLVEAISAQGGWLTFGWDLDEKEPETVVAEEEKKENHSIPAATQRGSSGLSEKDGEGFHLEATELANSVNSSSSGQTIEMERVEEGGIEGILNRLQEERNLVFAVGSQEMTISENLWGTSVDAASGNGRSSRSTSSAHSRHIFNDSVGSEQNGTFTDFDDMKSSLTTEMWRTWSAQRAGFPETEFEAAEIVPYTSGSEIHTISNNADVIDENDRDIIDSLKEPSSVDNNSYRDQIHSRLQCLELELTSVWRLLRSRTDSSLSHKGQGNSLEEIHKLSDAWEFQETEIMKARDKLRSTRAKLAVLEGKIALEIIEAQKKVKVKQKRIDDAKKALQILRTACIVWPSQASEVFLSGSFDGWTSRRRMERSSLGMFSLNLKLYPGRYEIKFIVDGVWTVDPLRPIINNNGYENNLLIIS